MVGTYWYNYVTNKTQAGPPEGVLDQEEQVDLSTLLIYQSPACSTNLLTICCCCAEMARPAAAAAARQHREEDNGWWSWCVFHAFLERFSRVFGASFTRFWSVFHARLCTETDVFDRWRRRWGAEVLRWAQNQSHFQYKTVSICNASFIILNTRIIILNTRFIVC